jgi:hypothetical protein
MATPKPFAHAGFLRRLERRADSALSDADTPLPAPLARILLAADGSGSPTPVAARLIQLLKAKQATLQAAFDTELAADELRRYQKFARPGAPSAHIVQLRQKQAGARVASSLSRQAFIKAAHAFVREAGLELPPRVTLEGFVSDWIDAHLPTDILPAA